MDYDIEKLIFLIESRPVLYNYTLKERNNRNICEKLWDEVAKEMKQSPNDCKAKWTSLRNSYARALRQEKDIKSGLAGSNRKRWYLTDAMSFLKDFMKPRTSMGSNLDKESETVLSEISDELNEHSSSSSLLSEPSTSFAIKSFETPPPAKRIKPINVTEQVDEPMITFPEVRSNQVEDENLIFFKGLPSAKRKKPISVNEQVDEPMITFHEARSNQVEDENLIFFKGLLPDMKKLSPRNQRIFKRDMYHRLCDLIDQQEYENMGKLPDS